MGRLDGKVAFITGVARGQGRAHAVRLAQEGADIIGVDICDDIDSVPYPLSSQDDLAHTVKLVEEHDRKIFTATADVRDRAALAAAYAEGVQTLGPVDIVLANAGIMPVSPDAEVRAQAWHDAIDVMVTGAFNTVEIAAADMVKRGAGGSIILTSSTAGLKAVATEFTAATPGRIGYTVAKHAVVGLMRSYANVLAEHNIRVNTIHPTGVNTPMVVNENFAQYVRDHPEDAAILQNPLPVQLLEPEDVAGAVAWLCSDEGRYVTGTTFVIDAGFTMR